MNPTLQKKVDRAVKLIKSASGNDVVEVCYSGGKDSDVILELAKMAGIKYRAIYKNTTIDPPGTIKHAIEMDAEIIRPKKSFLQLVSENGLPTRRARFCCEKLKEYKVLDKAIQGIRTCESSARSKRYNEENSVICRIYGSKKNHVNVILPILSWTDDDVKEFIEERGIKCHPLYYDKQGKFMVEKRLGCIGCPLKSNNGKGDYIANPRLFKAVTKQVIRWWNTHTITKSKEKFSTPYGLIAHNIFYSSYEDFRIADNNPLEGKRDWKQTLEKFFGIELP